MNPLTEFERWYKKAVKAEDRIPDAMALATATKSGRPAVRFILFKGIKDDSFCFFTNYKSQKSKDLLKNPQAEVCVFWPKLYRQARLYGRVSSASKPVSDAYWKTRPRLSQIGGWASPQSEVIKNYSVLTKRLKFFEKKFKGMEVPRPPHWGGFAIKPTAIEFWTGHQYRLHKRELYLRKGRRWFKQTLAP